MRKLQKKILNGIYYTHDCLIWGAGPSFLADQLAQSQPDGGGGQIMPTTLLHAPHSPPNFQTFAQPGHRNIF